MFVAAGSARAFGDDVYEVGAIIAELTKSGLAGSKAGQALKMAYTRLERTAAKNVLKDLGVQATDFIGIVGELHGKELLPEQWETLFGARNIGAFKLLVENSDRLALSLDAVTNASALTQSQFETYTKTTLAETTRYTNELQVAQIQLGERMKELAPAIENLKMQIQIAGMEMAAWALRNPAFVVSIIAGVMAIRAAFLALKASNPLGWIMVAIEGVIALGALLIGLSEDENIAKLSEIRTSKQALEAQKASVDTTRDEIKAKIDAIKATDSLTDEVGKLGKRTLKTKQELKGLEKQYSDLTDKSYELQTAILEQAKAEAKLQFAVESRAAAEAAGAGTLINRGALLTHLLNIEAKIIDLEKDEPKLIKAAADAQVEASMYLDDGNKLREIAIKYLKDALNISEDFSDGVLTTNFNYEEFCAVISQGNLALERARSLEAAAKDEIISQKEQLWEQLGLQNILNGLKDKSVKLTEADIEAGKAKARQVLIEIMNINALVDAKYEALKMEYTGNERIQKLLLSAHTTAVAQIDEKYWHVKALLDEMEGYQFPGIAPPGEEEGEKLPEQMTMEELLEKELELNEARWLAYSEEAQREEEDKKAREQRIRDFLGDLDEVDREKEIAAAKLFTEQIAWAGGNLANIVNEALFDSAEGFGKGLARAAGDFVKRLAAGIIGNAIIMLLLSAFDKGTFTLAGLFKGLIPGMKTGGMIPATPGGRLFLGGEGGEREYVIPESRLAAAFQRYGSLGPAYAAAQVSGETIAAAPNFTIQESVPEITLAFSNEGLLVATEKAHRARVIKQGR